MEELTQYIKADFAVLVAVLKKIQTEHGEAIIPILHDRNGEFESIVVPKHEGRGFPYRNLCFW